MKNYCMRACMFNLQRLDSTSSNVASDSECSAPMVDEGVEEDEVRVEFKRSAVSWYTCYTIGPP